MEDIDRVHDTLEAIQDHTENRDAVPFDHSKEVEKSVSNLFVKRVSKFESDVAFEDLIKQTIQSRLPEFEPEELIRVLDMLQRNSNNSLGNLLMPFNPKGDRIPLIDRNESGRAKEDKLLEGATKEDLKGINELAKLMRVLSKQGSE